MRHWWEPIGRLPIDAGVLSTEKAHAARRLFLEANGVVEMHYEVERDPQVEPTPSEPEVS